MKRLKNNVIQSRADAMIASRWGIIDTDIGNVAAQKKGNIEEFLRRGGKIKMLPPLPAAFAPPKKIINEVKKMEITISELPMKPVKQPKPTSAADIASKAADLSLAEVIASIPIYKHPLPRRQWVRKFFDALPVELHEKFNGLR